MIDYYEAFGEALKIHYCRPYILCGSVALIFVDALPVREVKGLDFICSEEKLNPFLPYESKIDRGEYTEYKVVDDEGFDYTLFVFKDFSKVKQFKKDHVRIQDIDQMLYYKNLLKPEDISAEFLL